MAVRNDFAAGEVLAAADLNDTFASKLDLAGGKILQIVRATDSTTRSTNSTSAVDVTGLAVTITPQKSDSAILILVSATGTTNWSTGDAGRGQLILTDASDNPLSGAELCRFGTDNITGTATRTHQTPVLLIGRDTPATTSPVTYKMRFSVLSANTTVFLSNGNQTAQIYAIEVSA
jgi:hypothetical protein